MELRQLQCFLAVVDEGTFTAAAVRLHVVQSAVSSTIKALERSLGVALFERGRRPMLTDAGRRLLPPARQMVELAATTREAVRTELSGELRVGVLMAVPMDLPRLLSRYRAAHPRVHVRMRAMPRGSADLVEALRSGMLDVAFVSVPGVIDPSLTLTPIVREPLVLLLPPDHPLASSEEPLSLADLAGETWIDAPEGYGNRTVVDAAFARAGLSREVALEVPDANTIPGLVAAGLGIGFLPPGIPVPPTVHTPQLATDDLYWPMYLATTVDRRDRPSVKAFTDLFNE
ncbi:LysR family transcriptional regulator [Actinophytocola sp.]|uniref:LysR family transcriptional regulator n=1 Tax=Actinophytocola sp. TaxID=1872138 RepID=UPI002ED4A99A